MRKLNVSPEDCLYIGDQPTDIQAAHATGMPCIGTLWGDGTVERLRAEGPSALAYEPQDILRFLAQGISEEIGEGP